MAHETTTKTRASRHRISRMMPRRSDNAFYLAPQLFRYPLIRIDREDPVSASQLERAIFLRAISGPVRPDVDDCAQGPTLLGRAVSASAVENDDFVRPTYGFDTTTYRALVVFGDYDRRDSRGAMQASTRVKIGAHFRANAISDLRHDGMAS